QLIIFFFFSSRRRHTRSYGDWSSDVCSSDLHTEYVDRTLKAHPQLKTRVVQEWETILKEKHQRDDALHGMAVKDLEASLEELREIGRASCRERGEISVGDV